MASNPIYKDLPNPKQEFRLIRISSTATPDSTPTVNSTTSLECKTPSISYDLEVFTLDDSPVFSALSYMWGHEKDEAEIIVNGIPMQVSVNLVRALRDVLHQWANGCCASDPPEERRLWVDAICINQTNTIEKNDQVPLMAKIYTKARRVFSWLGPEDHELYKSFDVLDFFSQLIPGFASYPKLLERIEDGYLAPVPQPDQGESATETEPQAWHESDDFMWLRNYCMNGVGPKPRPVHFWRIHALLFLPYWKRVWIYQELVLGSEVLILCGIRATSW
jgi:hypothetical protein